MPEDKFVLLTGSSSKLGIHIAELLAKKKYNILLHYFKSKEETISLSKKLESKFIKQKFIPVYIDLSKVNSKTKLRNLIPLRASMIGVINNASLYFKDTKNNFKFDDYQKNINIHFRNPLALISIIFENHKVNNSDYFAINITDDNLDIDNYYSYSKTKSMLSKYCNEALITNFKNIRILPAKDSLKNITSFKQEFIKLLK